MIHLTADTQIMIAIAPADFRCGIDGFVARCHKQLNQDAKSGILYVFINRRKTMVRALVYDGTGYWLMTKRLSKGKFKGWPKSSASLCNVVARQLRALLTNNDENWIKT